MRNLKCRIISHISNAASQRTRSNVSNNISKNVNFQAISCHAGVADLKGNSSVITNFLIADNIYMDNSHYMT